MNLKEFHKKVSKSYVHIDFPLTTKESSKFNKKIDDTKYVIRHRFLPLIQFDIVFQKHPNVVTKLSNGKVKQNIKTRGISLVSHHDTGVYAKYAEKLNTAYNRFATNKKISSSSVAYRSSKDSKGISNITVAKDVFDEIAKMETGWVIKGDFKGFFDNINHKILNENVFKVLGPNLKADEKQAWQKVLNALENYQMIDKEKFEHKIVQSNRDLPMVRESILNGKKIYNRAYFETSQDYGTFIKQNLDILRSNKKKGIPQGTSLSAILANVYMITLDEFIVDLISKFGGLYRRYSDDFIIVLPDSKITKEQLQQLNKIIQKKSDELTELTIESHKTKILMFNKGIFRKVGTQKLTSLDYLGFIFSDNTVSIRSKSIYKYYYRGKRAVVAADIARIIYRLISENPQLTDQEILKLFNEKMKYTKLYYNNLWDLEAKLNRVKRIRYHYDRNVGLPEIHKMYRGYLEDVGRVKPRQSFISYVKLAIQIFEEGEEKESVLYRLSFRKQYNKSRKKLQKRRVKLGKNN